MRKVYKILFVILLIILLKVVFQSEVFGVELWVYDQNGNQLSDGDEIKYNMQKDSKVELSVCFNKFALNDYSYNVGSDKLVENQKVEKQSTCRHGHEHELLYTADICGEGENDFKITLKSNGILEDTKKVTLKLVVSNSVENILKSALGMEGYNEVYIRDFTKDKLVQLIVNRSYTSYTNNDSKASDLKKWIHDPQFEYSNNSFEWENKEKYYYLELKEIKLKCIDSSNSTYWNKGETWKFNYSFYYIPDDKKLIFNYSQNLIKDKDGNDFDSYSGSQSENNYNSRKDAIINLIAEISGERVSSTFEDILDKIDDYDKPSDIDSVTSNKIENAASKVLAAITSVGIVTSIIIIAVLGIKYMLGSVEEKAEFKNDMIPYLIGACLLLGVTAFVKIFMQWGETISNL